MNPSSWAEGSDIRALTHVHTRFSWDSRTPIPLVVDTIERLDVKLALITDHDSYEGSRAVRAAALKAGMDVVVPTAAEIRTDRGDVIVAFDHDDVPPVERLKSWSSLPSTVAAHGGLVWIPHPYQSHTGVEEMAAEAEVIEVFNARCSPDQNRRAVALAQACSVVGAIGLDAHRRHEIERSVIRYRWTGEPLSTLRTTPRGDVLQSTPTSDIAAAEVVYGWRRRSPKKVVYFGVRWALARGARR